MAVGIYKITNPEGKVYIGQSINIRMRFNTYRCMSKSIQNHRKLYASLKKYGFDKHAFEIIEECEKSKLNQKERFYQDQYDVLNKGLNSRLQGTKFKKGVYSKESIENISKSRKGSTPWNKGKTTGQDVVNKKILLDTGTGVFYMSIKEAAEYNGFKRTTLNAMLTGQSKNRSRLIYV